MEKDVLMDKIRDKITYFYTCEAEIIERMEPLQTELNKLEGRRREVVEGIRVLVNDLRHLSKGYNHEPNLDNPEPSSLGS